MSTNFFVAGTSGGTNVSLCIPHTTPGWDTCAMTFKARGWPPCSSAHSYSVLAYNLFPKGHVTIATGRGDTLSELTPSRYQELRPPQTTSQAVIVA